MSPFGIFSQVLLFEIYLPRYKLYNSIEVQFFYSYNLELINHTIVNLHHYQTYYVFRHFADTL